MNVNATMEKLYDDVEKAIKSHKFKDYEVVQVKESVYRKAIEGEDHQPKDIFDLSLLVNQIYFAALGDGLLLKPVSDSEIMVSADFMLTTEYKKEVTGGNYA